MEKLLKKSSDFEQLPCEILFMVLVLLPAKLLLHMRSVCRKWRSIISDCSFIKAHLDRANDVHNNTLKRYMENAVCMRSTGFEESWTRFETVPMKQFSPSVEILASCNGLILLGDDISSYYLWNPLTRVLKQFDGPSIYRDELRNFALGYDATTKAYNVVRIVRFTGGRLRGSEKYVMWRRCDASVCDSTTASVYNSKTQIWETIEHFPYVICGNAQGVTVNGFPHWVMYRDHSANDQVIYPVIVCFDLVEDRFKEILKPDWLDQFSQFEYGVFEGKLCFVRYNTEQKIEVWVMQDYGESWINVTSLVDLARHRLPGWCGDRPLGYFGAMAFNEALYVESLVSPLGGDDNGDMIG